MWKLIDSEVLLQQVEIGCLISENCGRDPRFQITQIKDNGIIFAIGTDVTIIFPKTDLVDAKWWLSEKNNKEG